MGDLIRFGVSIDEQLLDSFDKLIEGKNYQTRSEAIRDLIRGTLVDTRAADDDAVMVGTITLVYDHHVRDLSEKLTDQQHAHTNMIVSSLHVHLDAHSCLEVLIVRGTVRNLKRVADQLIGVKGVKHGKLVMTSAGEGLHDHGDGSGVHSH